jgi:hypothetical protein
LIRLLESPDVKADDVEKKTTVLDAIRMAVGAWDDVSKDAIANCFRHCRILPKAPNTPASVSPVPAPVLTRLREQLEDLEVDEDELDDAMDDLLSVEGENEFIADDGTMSLDEIIDDVRVRRGDAVENGAMDVLDEEEDEEDDDRQPLTISQAEECIEQLQFFILYRQADNLQAYSSILQRFVNDLDAMKIRHRVQTKMTDFLMRH